MVELMVRERGNLLQPHGLLFPISSMGSFICIIPQTEGRKKIVLFNDALNTFYLWLHGVGHMVKDHSNSERGNPLQPHGLFFLISSMSYFICHWRRKLGGGGGARGACAPYFFDWGGNGMFVLPHL